MSPEQVEIAALEQTADWRRRRLDQDPADPTAAAAADRLDQLAGDLRRHDYASLWLELRSIENWLAESDAVSDYAALAHQYRQQIGITVHPADGADYLRALLAILRSLV